MHFEGAISGAGWRMLALCQPAAGYLFPPVTSCVYWAAGSTSVMRVSL